ADPELAGNRLEPLHVPTRLVEMLRDRLLQLRRVGRACHLGKRSDELLLRAHQILHLVLQDVVQRVQTHSSSLSVRTGISRVLALNQGQLLLASSGGGNSRLMPQAEVRVRELKAFTRSSTTASRHPPRTPTRRHGRLRSTPRRTCSAVTPSRT